MLMAFLIFQNSGNSSEIKTQLHHKYLFWIFKKLNNVYNDFKNLNLKISNKFDLGIAFMFKVGIIRIIL